MQSKSWERLFLEADIRACTITASRIFLSSRPSNTAPRQLELIYKTTQRSRHLGEDTVYLPHRLGGKLHVLKMDVGKDMTDHGKEQASSKSSGEFGKVISFDWFMRTEHSRFVV